MVTMAASRNVVKVGFTSVCDSNLIFSRLLGLQHSRNINIDDVLQHEVAPVSTSMFDDKGGMRIAAGKSALRNNIQVEISTGFVPEPDITIIDGCAILWIIHLPGNGTVQNFVNNVSSPIYPKATNNFVYNLQCSEIKNMSWQKSSGHWCNCTKTRWDCSTPFISSLPFRLWYGGTNIWH